MANKFFLIEVLRIIYSNSSFFHASDYVCYYSLVSNNFTCVIKDLSYHSLPILQSKRSSMSIKCLKKG